MDVAGAGNSFFETDTRYDDRLQELKTFDESKAGVKGLVDSGVTKRPSIFIRPPVDLAANTLISGEPTLKQFRIPIIDLKDVAGNYGGILSGGESRNIGEAVGGDVGGSAREFYELKQALMSEYYSREVMKKVKYGSNFDLYQSKYANWRDTLFCVKGGPLN